MHPFIKTYLNSEGPLHKIALSKNASNYATLDLCKQIDASLHDAVDSRRVELLSHMDDSILQGVSDAEVLVYYYLAYGRLYHACRDSVNSIKMLEHALLQIEDQSDGVIKAQVYVYLGYHSLDNRVAMSYFQKALRLFKFKFKREYIILINVLMYYANSGSLQSLPKKTLELVEQSRSAIVEGYLVEVKFIDAVINGNHEKSKEYLKMIPSKSRTSRLYRFMMLMRINNDEWDTSLWADIPDQNIKVGGHLPFVGLKNGNPEEMLAFIKTVFSVEDPGRIDFCLRAELANHNIVAAKKLMLEKGDIASGSFMDQFFLMRIALLEGDKQAANYYFHQLMRLGDKLNNHGRINFELNLAIEIKRSDLKDLCYSRPVKTIKLKSSFDKKAELKGVEKLIGDAPSISAMRATIKKYAPSDLLVLIQGETGTGKEVVARSLHEESSRSKLPYLTINCGAISETLLQTELFGYTKGAFTGATSSRKGIFEAAEGGTVFLDEVGEVSPQVQVALLRVLEANEVRPVGSTKSQPLACRIVMATNADLESLVSLGVFRQDLFYRINKLQIKIPPLRDRRVDVLVLANYFLNLNRQDNIKATFSDELAEAMTKCSWLGNVRQLKNEIEKLRFLFSEKSDYELSDWPLLSKEVPAEVAPKPAVPEYPEVSNEVVIVSGNTPFRRLEKIKALFLRSPTLTIAEISKALDVKSRTIGNDMKKLIEMGLVERVCPTPSRRTHYFISKSIKK